MKRDVAGKFIDFGDVHHALDRKRTTVEPFVGEEFIQHV